MLRSIAGVVTGYVIFGVAALALFPLIHRDPHAAPGLGLVLASTLYGVVFAGLGGFVAARIAGRRPLMHAGTVGLLVALAAIVSMIFNHESSTLWSELATLLLMAPAAFCGGAVELSRMGREHRRTLLRVK